MKNLVTSSIVALSFVATTASADVNSDDFKVFGDIDYASTAAADYHVENSIENYVDYGYSDATMINLWTKLIAKIQAATVHAAQEAVTFDGGSYYDAVSAEVGSAEVDALVAAHAETVEKLNAKLDKRQGIIETFQAKVAKKDAFITKLKETRERLTGERDEARADVEDLQAQLDATGVTVAEVEVLTAEVDTLTAEVEVLAAANANIPALNAQIAQLTLFMQVANATIDQEIARADAAEAEVEALTAQVEALTNP